MVAIDVRAIVAGCAALALFIGGFSCGHKRQAGKLEDAEHDRDRWEATAGQWEAAQKAWEKRYATDQAAAVKQRKAAKDALANVERDRKAAAKEATNWRARFNAAQSDPDCIELMRATSCPAFSDY